MRTGIYVISIGVVLGVLTTSAMASSVCYEDRYYPSVVRLDPTDNGFRAVLGGKFKPWDSEIAPTVIYDAERGWRDGWERGEPETCAGLTCARPQRCPHPIPDIPLSAEQAQEWGAWRHPRELHQSVGACVQHREHIYFGIAFYDGEGEGGIGGLGRYHPESGKLEIRRPAALMHTSVTHIVHDGELLWLATGDEYECFGTVPSRRLVSYDWQNAALEPASITLCGFVIHDMHLRKDGLWLATDMGIAQKPTDPSGRRLSGGWRYFLPDTNARSGVVHRSCHELYEELLDTLPVHGYPAAPLPLAQLVETLGIYKPHILARWIQNHRGRPEVSAGSVLEHIKAEDSGGN